MRRPYRAGACAYLAARGRHLLRLLLTFFLSGLDGLLGHVLAALHGLLASLLRLVLDLVGHRADLLVLHARGGDEEPGDEADRRRADGKAERVLLGNAHRLAGTLLDVLAARRGAGDGILRARQRGLHALDLVRYGLACTPRYVGLVAKRLRRVAHAGARRLYVIPDLARVFAHCTSSLTLSSVCSGATGAASLTFCLPRSASTPAMAAYTPATIRAAAQIGSAPSNSTTKNAVSVRNAPRPNSPAPPNIPAPMPAGFAFWASSAFINSISCRTSVVVSFESRFSSSPVERSISSLSGAVMSVALSRSASPPHG